METLILQDWTTVQGGSNATLTQGEADWLDLSVYQDAVLWLLAAQASGSPLITFQTSPTEDEAFFTAVSPQSTLVAASAPTILSVLMLSSTVPIARFLRWQITSSSAWSTTFRAIVSANRPGV